MFSMYIDLACLFAIACLPIALESLAQLGLSDFFARCHRVEAVHCSLRQTARQPPTRFPEPTLLPVCPLPRGGRPDMGSFK